MRKVCIFVDGENLRHAICDLFDPEFEKSQYLPKNADWTDFFDWLSNQCYKPDACERIRAYWYVVQFLDFYPYDIPTPQKSPETLKRLLSKHPPFQKSLSILSGEDLTKSLQELYDELSERQQQMKHRFDGWTVIQNGISTYHRAVEFRRAGGIRYNLFDKTLGQEKAVDVKLAVDLILLKDIYDVALIVSGDQDYIPAVQEIKDFGKSVINTSFLTRSGKLLPGGARRLNQHTDASLEVSFSDFKKFMKV